MTNLETMKVEQGPSNISVCDSYDIPSIPEYLKAANEYGIALLCVGALALIIVTFLFFDTLRYVIRHSSSRVKAFTAVVLAVYPVTCLMSFFAILVPRAYLLSEALTQGMFMVGMYQLFCLFVSYSGGDAALVKLVKPNKLSLKVGPLCCFPCCSFFPTFEVNKKTVKYLKLLVLQLPLVQGLVYFVLLVMWAEAESLYQINYMYIQPIIIISMLFGIWGILMVVNVLKDVLDREFLLLQKFGVLQLVLLLGKLQGIATRALIKFDVLPCRPPITPQVYAILIHNLLMMLEMVILAVLARNVYKRSIPDISRKSINAYVISTLGNGNTNLTDNDNPYKTKLVYDNNNVEANGYENAACDQET